MKEALRQQCPPPEQLAALFEQRLSEAESRSVHQHIQGCTSCKADYDMLADFSAAVAEPQEALDVERIARNLKAKRQPRKSGSWFAMPMLPRFAGAFALLIVSIAIGLQWRAQRAPELSPLNDSGSLRSGENITITPQGDLPLLPSEFSWTPVAAAAGYAVTVSEVDGKELWRTRTTQPHVAIPHEILLPSKTVLCQITALDSNGARVAQSPPTPLRYKP